MWSGSPTQCPPLFFRVCLRRLLHLYGIIDDEVHELVEALNRVNVEFYRQPAGERRFPYSNLSLNADGHLFVQPY